MCSRDGCTCMGCTYIAGCWRLERKWPCPVHMPCVPAVCFMLAGPWQGWHVVPRSMCQWVLLLGHYRVYSNLLNWSQVSIYCMLCIIIILHFVALILSAVCNTRSRLPATAGTIACMCCLHMCTSSIGLGHPSTGIVAHQLRPHTKTHPLKGDTTFNTEQYLQQSTLETI